MINKFSFEFVDHIPSTVEDGKLYISIPFATVVHRCACGCGREVVTPLTPTDWRLIFDGDTVSLHPSIGNWNFPCQSHYWIRENAIHWAPKWSEEEIKAGRTYDRTAKARYFETAASQRVEAQLKPKPSLWQRFRSLWS